jgi:hypothetical protein
VTALIGTRAWWPSRVDHGGGPAEPAAVAPAAATDGARPAEPAAAEPDQDRSRT